MEQSDEQSLRTLIREELQSIHAQPTMVSVQDAVSIAVRETLVTLGMDASDPLRLQRDMAFLREMRSAHERVKSRGLLVLVGFILTGALTAMWLGIKNSMGNP